MNSRKTTSTNNSGWYKEMYLHIHKPPENKKVEQQNPYKPTYTFPSELDGNLRMMEDFIRKAASQSDDETSTNDQKNPSIQNDAEQKNVYKRILRGAEIPSAGLQKFLPANRDKPTNSRAEQVRSTPTSEETRESSSSKSDTKLSSPISEKSSKSSQPIYKALALHTFNPQTHRELPFKKGDTFFVRRRINDDWLEGEHQGLIGIFPLNHVELFPIEQETDYSEDDAQNSGEAIVKYDFIPEKTFELQLRKGEKVVLLRRLDNNWYEGRINHLEGIFPAAYVETLKEPPNGSSLTKTSNNPSSKSVSKTSKATSPIVIETKSHVSDSPCLMRKCQVLYDYKPQNADELEIHVGDIITIVEMCDDGWYCGLMENSKYTSKMEFGTFPGNYVKLLPETN